ncbi:MAG: selenide, water dikinase SelD [Verrucomicrobia bacterium]|nr:selenide, water dikinase SelD [Verrucomicrobiota bacterium]
MDPMEKRKRVMSRSAKLGHCVCDPRKPCPCPLFKEKKICTCAGERVPMDDKGGKVRLTDFVRSAGCASKIGQKDLHAVLGKLPVVSDPRLLVGMATADDAGVFKLAPDVTIVQTVDVFTPGVDDPYLFGRIAACNSLSDVYAMGGTPVTALSIIGFPIDSLPHDVMALIIKGGMDVLKEAGTILLGGHSINDEEIKFGFAVTGVVDSSRVVTNAGARVGDALVLTKPLGTGIVSLAARIGLADAGSVREIEKSMSTLNKAAAEVMARHDAGACTDVTGFGFIGHLCQLVKESHVTAEIWFNSLPLFQGVLKCAGQGTYSGANERNLEYSADRVDFGEGVSEAMKAVLFDAQTSGGLLISVPFDDAEGVVEEMKKAGVADAAVVGRITEKSGGRIRVISGKDKTMSRTKAVKTACCSGDAGKSEEQEECCSHAAAGSGDAMKLFTDFMGKVLAPGAVDVVTKEQIAVALGLAVHCVPCSKIHIRKALSMGVSGEELEEVAALGVAFGGCRAMMLWNELKKELLG